MFKFSKRLKKAAAILLSAITTLSTMSVGITAASAASHSCSDITNCREYVHNVGTGYNSIGGRLMCNYNGHSGGVYFFNASNYNPLSMNDKGVAFCIQNSNEAPWTGFDKTHYGTNLVDINDLIGRVFTDKYGKSSTLDSEKANLVLRSLYYGWNGPGCVYGDNDYQKGYLVTRAVASHYFQGSGAKAQDIGMLKGEIVTAYPNTDPTKLKLSNTDLKFRVETRANGSVYLKSEQTQLISADPTVNLKTKAGKDKVSKKYDANATISFTVPWRGEEGVDANKLFLVNDTETSKTGKLVETASGQTVTLHGGDKFHFTARVANTQDVHFSNKSCKTSVASVYVLPPLDAYKKYQTLARLFYAPSSQALSFNIEAPDVTLQLQKVSSNTSMTDGNDCYSFEGAEFAVFDDKDKASTAKSGAAPEERKKGAIGVIVTDKSGKGTLAEKLPIGDYYAVEAKAPTNGSYKLNDNIFTFNSTNEYIDGCIVYKAGVGSATTIPEEPYNDPMFINITKTDSEGNVIANLETVFEVKYYDGYYTQESEIDESKLKATWYFKTIDGEVRYDEAHFDESRESSELFYRDERKSEPAIPLGTITIREVEAPKGTDSQGNVIEYKLDDTLRIHQIQRDFGTGTTEEEYTFDDEIVNEPITIDTEAVEKSSNSHTAFQNSNTEITDTISYTGLNEQENYEAVGWLVKKSDGKRITDIISQTFKADTNGCGSVELTHSFNSTGYGDETVVAFAEIRKSGSDDVIVEHKDINDKDQSVTFLESGITTEVKDYRTGTNKAYAARTVSLTDTITYNNIKPGSYTIITRLAIKDKNGNTQLLSNRGSYTFASNEFVVGEGEKGTKDVVVSTFASGIINAFKSLPEGCIDNPDTLDGKSLVLFQYIVNDESDISNNTCVAKHEDINDSLQTITFVAPKVSTRLTNDYTPNSRLSYERQSDKFTDMVTINGLIVGKEYTVKGELVTQDGEKIADSKTTSFVASAERQTVKVGYANVDTTKVATADNPRVKISANIEVYYNASLKIAEHNGVGVPSQTLTVVKPTITTKAKGETTQCEYSYRSNYNNIIDTVTYKNVIPGVPVKLYMSAVDGDTGEYFGLSRYNSQDEIITESGVKKAALSFTPTKSSGDIEIGATVENNGKSKMVIYEELRYADDTTIAEHMDITDKDQTVTYVSPSVITSAVDSETKSHIGYSSKNTTIVDTVTMANLIPGKTYTISGVLMNKTADAKGKTSLLVNGAEVTATKTFTAGTVGTGETVTEQNNGLITQVVPVEYIFDSTEIDVAEIVVFENLYIGNFVDSSKLIANHRLINDEAQTVTIYGLGEILINKFDGATTKPLQGVKFKLYDGEKNVMTFVENAVGNYSASGKGTVTTLVTDENGEIKIDKLDKGTYFYQEVETSGNYMFDDSLIELTVLPNEVTVEGVPNIPKKGDIMFAKVDSQQQYLANATFDIFADAKCTEPAKDFYNDKDYDPVTTDESGLVVFHDVPYGVYYIKETDTASDKALLEKPIVANVNENGTTLTYNDKELSTVDIEGDGGVTKLPTIVNDDITISTTAVDSTTNSHSAFTSTSTTIKDTVTYKGLRVGETYTLTGVLMDKDSNGELLVNGNRVTATKTFKPTKANGGVDVSFTFNSSGLANKSVVVFETLSIGREVIAEHKDINDALQTVSFTTADLATKAVDKSTGSNKTHASNTTTIIDTVFYNGLIVNETYTFETKLIEKESRSQIGSTKKTQYTPTTADGNINIEMTFDSSAYAGKSVVVYEKLIRNSDQKVIATHEEINDAGQTIEFVPPTITTRANNNTFGGNIGYAGFNGIADYINLEGLVVGQKYTINSRLVNKEDGSDLVVNGQTVKQSKTFTATAESMEVGIGGSTYKFSTSDLAGKSIVFFEELVWNGATIANHNDLNDAAQTITYIEPSLKTEARDSDTQGHYAYTSNMTKIIDTVTYDGVVVGTGGHQMTISAIDKATGSVIATKKVGFNPITSSGSVDVDISFDSKEMAGKSIVIYEELSFAGRIIAAHKDINDASQTVTFMNPSVGTVATDKTSGTHTSDSSSSTTIVDKVTLSGLIVGETYTIKGKLVNKNTGKILILDGAEVVAEKEIEAETESQIENIEFTFDSSNLGDIALVAYEDLVYNNVIIASHRDINDENQTVNIHGRGNLNIYKANSETNEPLAGAKFKLYYDEALTQEVKFGAQYSLGDVNMDKKINNADALIIQQIVQGVRTPTETQKLLADINEDGEINEEDSVLIQKMILDKATLPSKYIFDESGDSTLVTGADGYIYLSGLLSGKYYLKEIEAPEHYKIDVEVTGIEIKALDTSEEVVKNTPEKGNIEFVKVGEDKEPIEGVEFKIFSDEAKTTPAANFYGVEYESVVTGADGKVEFKGIGYGTYYIAETQTENGKQLLVGTIMAVVDESGTTLTINGQPLAKKAVTNEDGEISEVDIVENVDIPNMPITGGIGIWIGTVLGVLLVGGGVIFLFVRKRKSNRTEEAQ